MKFENLQVEDIKLIKGAMLESSVNLIATCQECKGAMTVDTFYKEMDKANRLIYLVNVLNDVENYEYTMKFYEFNEFGYYALIGAKSSEEAIKYYEETVGNIEEDDGMVDEISKEEAKEKLLNICKNEQQKHEAIEEFTKCINQNEPYLILIDGSLL